MISSVRHCKKITSPVNFKTYMSNDYPHLRLTTASEQFEAKKKINRYLYVREFVCVSS